MPDGSFLSFSTQFISYDNDLQALHNTILEICATECLLVKYHFIVIEPVNSGASLPVYESQLYHLLAV